MSDGKVKEKQEEKLEFQAEVAKVLNLVIHSLYSNKEIFLRELISNASDACDKLRYLALTTPGLLDEGTDFKIDISTNKKERSITVADNGIGMNREELIENLGTIARSGTTAFLDSLSGDEQKDAALIGQFGVGFYSCFSVAEKVEVITRKAGDEKAWAWTSDGVGAFSISETERENQGATVTVYLKKEDKEFIEETRIQNIVKTYSDHISIPIMLAGKEKASQINAGSALWTRQRKDITEEQYKEFYHHVGHVFDDPWLTLHNRAEGKIEYTNLLFIPSSPPFDLMNPERKHRVKLYVKRIFITDDCEDLMPSYLRFVRGIVDSEDLPLNVSREMLQHNVVVTRIKSALVKRVFRELKKKAEKKPEEYDIFWQNFGAVLKEGLYEDHSSHDKLLELVRFRSTAGTDDQLVSLAEYVERMKDGQEEIFYITGDSPETLRASPQLEGFQARGAEVLLLTDPIDEFWLPAVAAYQEKRFTSVTASGIDLSKIKKETKEGDKGAEKNDVDNWDDAAVAKLILAFKESLGEAVKDVRASDRLTESAVCLVAAEGDMDLHLQRMLKMQGHMDIPATARVLEFNPGHSLIKKLTDSVDKAAKKQDIADAALVLFDQARIVEGEAIDDPASFSQRLNWLMEKGLAG
ncbi:MAG: molecular chaperone HtpG [Rhodospirillaceae bacterium]|nr:molecular chaperone HtpG [Rhodospirillaceae bacterium]